MPKRSAQKSLTNASLMLGGILCAGMGIKGFLLSSHFIDGGVTGISMLFYQTTKIPLYWLLPALNLPFLILAAYQISVKCAIKSALGILGLALCLAFVQYPDVTSDKLLTAVFGGIFLGAGIGLAIRGGAVIDGTDIIALIISRLNYGLRVGDIVLIFNIFIFLAAAFFLGIEPALYSILTYMSASKTVNFILHGIEEYTAVIIISTQYTEIKEAIIHDLKRTVTVYKGAGGVSGQEQDILYCVVTKLEIPSIKNVIYDIDPDAFVVTHALADAEGGVLKKQLVY